MYVRDVCQCDAPQWLLTGASDKGAHWGSSLVRGRCSCWEDEYVDGESGWRALSKVLCMLVDFGLGSVELRHDGERGVRIELEEAEETPPPLLMLLSLRGTSDALLLLLAPTLKAADEKDDGGSYSDKPNAFALS